MSTKSKTASSKSKKRGFSLPNVPKPSKHGGGLKAKALAALQARCVQWDYLWCELGASSSVVSVCQWWWVVGTQLLAEHRVVCRS